MSRKIISCIFLLFIIIVSLVFSHFIYRPSIESFYAKEDTVEDTLLNPEQATGPAPAPESASEKIQKIQSSYGVLSEGFDTKMSAEEQKPSSQGVFDYLFHKIDATHFSLPKI